MRFSQSAKRDGLCHSCQHFFGRLPGLGRLVFGNLVESRRPGRTGQDVVHGDAIGAQFTGEGFGPIGHRTPHGIGHTQSIERLFDGGGNHIDDAPSSRSAHARKNGLNQSLVANQVLGKCREIGVGIGCMGRSSRRSSGVVDEDVHGLGSGHRFSGGSHLIWSGEVRHDVAMAIARKCFQCRGKTLAIPCHQGATRAQCSKFLGRCEANALGGSTHQGVFSLKVHLHGRNVPPYLRRMLTGIQHLHGTLRWVVLGLMIFSIVKAFVGMSSSRSFGVGDQKRGMFTMISLHLQLVLGFVLYFGKGWGSMLGNAEAMGNTVMRFFSLEHMVTMLIAVVLGTLGHSLSKRATDDRTKFRRQAIWFTVSLIMILASIPWPFRPGFEAYGWW